MSRRSVITGLGVIAPGGNGVPDFWSLISSGKTATRTITAFDPSAFRSQMAAECDFAPERSGLSPREVQRMDRAGQFAVVAAREALADAQLIDPDPGRVGVVIGSAVGATTSLEREYVVTSDSGRKHLVDFAYVTPHLADYMVPSSLARDVAWSAAAEGPVVLVSNGCTSGIDAVGHASTLIEEGAADVVIAGASDAPISPITVACFDAIKATSPDNDTPDAASRPFDATRNGFVLGEGAAVLVLESEDHARRRGALIHATVAGYAARSNAFHMTGLRPDGRELAAAANAALAAACLEPGEVDYVNAHGSGTKQNDIHETAAIKRSLGQHARSVPISSIKSMIGHSLGAIGSLEIVACVLSIVHGFVPPTANLHAHDEVCDLDYTPLIGRSADLGVALTLGSGFGGFQSAMVLTGGEESDR